MLERAGTGAALSSADDWEKRMSWQQGGMDETLMGWKTREIEALDGNDERR